jgi:hypothetical protein
MTLFFQYIPAIMIYDQQGAFRGFCNAMPSAARMPEWDAHLEGGSVNFTYEWISDELKNYPLVYWCEKLPAGKYTLVMSQPNYPPLMKQVTLTSGVNTIDFNADEAKVIGTSISGVVKSTEGVIIVGANVSVRNKNASIEKVTTTNENGEFKISGIPTGVYRIDVARAGYAMGGAKVSVTATPAQATILLNTADASAKGTVYTTQMGTAWIDEWRKGHKEIKIIAYDETENGLNASAYLPTYKAIPDTNNQFYLPDFIGGHSYKIYCIADDAVLEWKDLTAAAGQTGTVNFTLSPSRPRLKIHTKRVIENNRMAYNFIIECPHKLINPRDPALPAAPQCSYSPVSSVSAAFDPAKATELLVEPGSNNTYSVTFQTPSDDEFFKMRILATDGINYYYEDIVFGPKIEAKAKKDLAGELAEGGQVEIDATGSDTTKLGLDPGALTPNLSSATYLNSGGVVVPIGGFLSTLPNFQLSRTQSAKSIAMQKLVDSIVASDVYEIDLADAQMNKALTVTLNYNRDRVGESELGQLRIGRYNEITGDWEIVPGIVTANPLTGTVSVDVESIGGTTANPAPKAKFDGKKFVINRAASTDQSASPSVLP